MELRRITSQYGTSTGKNISVQSAEEQSSINNRYANTADRR